MRHFPSAGASLNAVFVFAHGAGAGESHPFMTGYASAVASRGVEVVTFNFPYMDARRRIPDRVPVLEACFESVVAQTRALPGLADHVLFIGGKSMGGRMATHLAAKGLNGLRGVVALGYPLHPPGKPEQLRVAHLAEIRVPLLIVQGERDAFGTPGEIAPHAATIPGGATVHVVKGGDHSLRTKGAQSEQTRADVATAIASWMARLL